MHPFVLAILVAVNSSDVGPDDVSQRDRPRGAFLNILKRRAHEPSLTPQCSMDAQSPDQTRSALVLYGSETGNAQEVAEELGALAERLRFATHVSELNQSNPVCTISQEHLNKP